MMRMKNKMNMMNLYIMKMMRLVDIVDCCRTYIYILACFTVLPFSLQNNMLTSEKVNGPDPSRWSHVIVSMLVVVGDGSEIR